MNTRSQPELVRTIPSQELREWQQWEAQQPREAGQAPRLLALVALVVIIPLLGWVLYIPIHIDAFVLWIELTVLFAGQRAFEERALLHPTELTIMVALYVSLSSVARLVDYLRVAAALGLPIQPFDLAYKLVCVVLLFLIGYAGGQWLARDARRRFERWQGWH